MKLIIIIPNDTAVEIVSRYVTKLYTSSLFILYIARNCMVYFNLFMYAISTWFAAM